MHFCVIGAEGPDGASGAGHEDWAVRCRFRRHIAYLVIAFRRWPGRTREAMRAPAHLAFVSSK
jgi:hypothetical protein